MTDTQHCRCHPHQSTAARDRGRTLRTNTRHSTLLLRRWNCEVAQQSIVTLWMCKSKYGIREYLEEFLTVDLTTFCLWQFTCFAIYPPRLQSFSFDVYLIVTILFRHWRVQVRCRGLGGAAVQGRAGLWRMSVECKLAFKTKVKQRFTKVSKVFYSRPSLMKIMLASQFLVYYCGFNIRLA